MDLILSSAALAVAVCLAYLALKGLGTLLADACSGSRYDIRSDEQEEQSDRPPQYRRKKS